MLLPLVWADGSSNGIGGVTSQASQESISITGVERYTSVGGTCSKLIIR